LTRTQTEPNPCTHRTRTEPNPINDGSFPSLISSELALPFTFVTSSTTHMGDSLGES